MLEGKLDLFNPPDDADAICITTNGMIRSDGKAVMGRGVALAAKNKFLGIDTNLAIGLKKKGNVVDVIYVFALPVNDKFVFVFSFPTKKDWRDNSDTNLIVKSCHQLVDLTTRMGFSKVLLPRPGCANGGLSWTQVKPIIEPILDDRFTVVWR